MIIPSKDKCDESKAVSASVEQPPSYDDVTRDSEPATDHVVVRDRKRPFVRALSRSTPTPGPSSARPPGVSPKAQSPSTPTASSPSSSSWISRTILGNVGPSSKPTPARPSAERPTLRSQADVRTTVLGLVRDLVARASSTLGTSIWADDGVAARGVLDSCVVVCARQQVSLAAILQELSVENHVPAYWAIIQRPPSPKGQTDDALMKLLALSAPLTQYTIYELRLACLATHSNITLQRIRSSPSIFPFSGTDCVLLQGSDSAAPARGFRDVVEVMEGGETEVNEGAFSVRLELEMFQRRMRVSNEVQVEFIARGRIWSLIFFVIPTHLPHPYLEPENEDHNSTTAIPQAAYTALRMLPKPLAPGTWACCLSLRAGSPECWVDGRITVREPDPSAAYEGRDSRDETVTASMQASMQKPLPTLHTPSVDATELGGYDEQKRHVRTYSQPDYQDQLRSMPASRSPINSSLADLPSCSPNMPEPGSSYSIPRGGIPSFTMPPDVNPFRSALTSPTAHLSPPPSHPLRSSPSTPSLISALTPSNYSSASSKLALASMLSWKPPKARSGSKPPLTLRLRCVHGPLVAPPPPPYTSLPLALAPRSPLVSDTPDGGGGGSAEPSKKDVRRARKQAKKDAKVRAAKEKRARAGKETRKEKAELEQEAHTVVVVGLGEGMDGRGDGKGGMGKLMYDGCSYIAQDGFLRATLEAKLGKPESECIIC